MNKKFKQRSILAFKKNKNFRPVTGLAPLADEVTVNGIVVSEVGLNHHYRDPNIDKKTIALALVIPQIEN